jgi:hypothetical protein
MDDYGESFPYTIIYQCTVLREIWLLFATSLTLGSQRYSQETTGAKTARFVLF